MPTAEMVVIVDAHHAVPMERPWCFKEVLRSALG